jgi:predicted alpha/beta superfamily hydrolase
MSSPQLPDVTGELRFHELQSAVFRNARLLRVWVPPGYDNAENGEHRFPVLYLNDGQNLFQAETSYTGVEWQMDETADRLIREGKISPLIVVGIDHGGKDRMKEYVPYRSFSPAILRPQGRRYPEFLMDEVMPSVARNYRVAAGSENVALGGSSLGGLIALYTAMARPGMIGRLLIESPSLFMSSRQLLREARGFKQWPQRVYMAMGTRESGRPDRDQSFVNDVLRLAQNMKESGLGEERLRVNIAEGATHSEAEWAKRLPDAMEFLFRP